MRRNRVFDLAALLLGILIIPAVVWATSSNQFVLKDSTGGGTDITVTNASGAATVSGATSFDFGSATITYAGAPSWDTTTNQAFDDGTTDSPYIRWVDGTNNRYGQIYKIDNGNFCLLNDNSAEGISLMPSGDTNDYFAFTTVSNVPTLTIQGDATLDIITGASAYVNFKVANDTDDYFIIQTASNVPILTTASSAMTLYPTGNLNIQANDVDDYLVISTTADVPRIGVTGDSSLQITTDNAAANLDIMVGNDTSDYVRISTTANVPRIGAIGNANLEIAAESSGDINLFPQGETDNYLNVTASANELYIKTANADDLYIVPVDDLNILVDADADDYFTFSIVNANTPRLSTIGDSGMEFLATGDLFTFLDGGTDTTVAIEGYEAKEARLILRADQGDEATDSWQFDVDTSGNLSIGNDQTVMDTFVDVLVLSAAGDVSLAGTTPYLTIGDNADEDNGIIFNGDADFYMGFDATGGIAENMLTIGNGSTMATTPVIGIDGNGLAYVFNTDATADAVEDILTIYKSTSGSPAAGLGVGVVFSVEDAGDQEEQASLDIVSTDVTNGAEDFDVVVKQMTAGTVSETLRIVAASAAAASDYLQFTANTTETNATLDVLKLKTSAVTGEANMGLGISFEACDAGGSEQQGSIDNVITTATNGAEMSAFVMSVQSAGTIAEVLRAQGASSATVSDYVTITANTTEDNGIVTALKLAQATGTGASGNGIAISFEEEDAGESESQGTIANVLTTATDDAEMSDFVFSIQSAGAIDEVLRVVANTSATTSDYLKVTANTTEDNGVVDALMLLQDTGTGANGNGIGITFQPEDAGGAEEGGSLDLVLTDATNGTEDAAFVMSVQTAGTVSEAFRVQGASSATVSDYVQITANTTEDNGVVDPLILTQATGTGASGNGLGISFQPEDAGEAEEQGSLDCVLTTATDDAEMAAFVMNLQTAGTVAEVLRVQGASAAAASDYVQITANTSETNDVVDVLKLVMATGTATNNIGMGISWQPEDATGAEEHASLDVVLTDATRATCDADFVFTNDVNGTLTETLRIDADAGIDLSLAGGKIIMSNDEYLVNSTDAAVALYFDDDAAELGKLAITSSNAQGNMAINDYFTLTFNANDNAGNATDYAAIQAKALAVANGSEAGALEFLVTVNGTNTEQMQIDNTGILLENGEYLLNSVADAHMEIRFDDDAVELGELLIRSDNAHGSLANDDYLRIQFEADDNAGNITDYAAIDAKLLAIANGTEAGAVEISVASGASLVEIAQVDINGISVGATVDADKGYFIDGTTQDFYLAEDSATDDLYLGKGTTVTATPYLTFKDDSYLISVGAAAEADAGFLLDGHSGGVDWYIAQQDSSDDLMIGRGATLDTLEYLTMYNNSYIIKVGDATESDAGFYVDGNTQDFAFGIDDATDTFNIQNGTALDSTTPSAISIASTNVVTFGQTAVFSGGQTREVIIPVEDVDLDGASAPSLATNGTNGQWIGASLEFDADGGATGDDFCYIQWVVPAGYVADSGRLLVYWSFDSAEDAADECTFDMAVNAVAEGETLDAAGTGFAAQATVVADASADAGKMFVESLNFEVEDIAVGDLVTIKFWVDEDASAMANSQTADIHMFKIIWESTE